MSAKPATPLQDGGLRPRRVVPFAVVIDLGIIDLIPKPGVFSVSDGGAQ